jgi:heme-degrading monooxygenase HmoA
MIARTWRGWTAAQDTDAYVDYLSRTGIAAYLRTPGNRGAWILHRPDDDKTEFITLTFWESLEAVRVFAGEDIERAVFYPEDDVFLVERDDQADHFQVVDGQGR